MRTLNMKTNKNTNFTPWAIKKIDICDKHPCWYVRMERDGTREEAYWVVGLKEDGEKAVELEIMATRLGDVNNEEFWNHFVSYEFALNLLNKFRAGRVQEVTKED